MLVTVLVALIAALPGPAAVPGQKLKPFATIRF